MAALVLSSCAQQGKTPISTSDIDGEKPPGGDKVTHRPVTDDSQVMKQETQQHQATREAAAPGHSSSSSPHVSERSERSDTLDQLTDRASSAEFKSSQLERPRKIKGEKLETQARSAAVIIFLRSSVVASAVDAQVYDVSSGAPAYVGRIANNTRLHHELPAGRHIFMLVADSVDYLVVEVRKGHAYYAVVKPSMGVWKPKFSFVPIKAANASKVSTSDSEASDIKAPLFFGDTEVDAMLSAMTPIVYSKEFVDHPFDLVAVEKRYKSSWSDWSSEQENYLQRKTLLQNDGRKVH